MIELNQCSSYVPVENEIIGEAERIIREYMFQLVASGTEADHHQAVNCAAVLGNFERCRETQMSTWQSIRDIPFAQISSDFEIMEAPF